MPTAVTSLIQLMDQNVLKNLKRNYRHSISEHILEKVDEAGNII